MEPKSIFQDLKLFGIQQKLHIQSTLPNSVLVDVKKFNFVIHFLSGSSTLVTSRKKCFLHFLMHWVVVLKKVVLRIFLSNLSHHLFFKFWNNPDFWISYQKFVFSLIFWYITHVQVGHLFSFNLSCFSNLRSFRYNLVFISVDKDFWKYDQ
jgi:hypothetical protein